MIPEGKYQSLKTEHNKHTYCNISIYIHQCVLWRKFIKVFVGIWWIWHWARNILVFLGFSSNWVSKVYWMTWNSINVFPQIPVGKNDDDEDNYDEDDEDHTQTHMYTYDIQLIPAWALWPLFFVLSCLFLFYWQVMLIIDSLHTAPCSFSIAFSSLCLSSSALLLLLRVLMI